MLRMEFNSLNSDLAYYKYRNYVLWSIVWNYRYQGITYHQVKNKESKKHVRICSSWIEKKNIIFTWGFTLNISQKKNEDNKTFWTMKIEMNAVCFLRVHTTLETGLWPLITQRAEQHLAHSLRYAVHRYLSSQPALCLNQLLFCCTFLPALTQVQSLVRTVSTHCTNKEMQMWVLFCVKVNVWACGIWFSVFLQIQ